MFVQRDVFGLMGVHVPAPSPKVLRAGDSARASTLVDASLSMREAVHSALSLEWPNERRGVDCVLQRVVEVVSDTDFDVRAFRAQARSSVRSVRVLLAPLRGEL